jgi:hypothetical protein
MLQLCQLVQHLLHLLPIRSLLLHERLYALRMVQQDSLQALQAVKEQLVFLGRRLVFLGRRNAAAAAAAARSSTRQRPRRRRRRRHVHERQSVWLRRRRHGHQRQSVWLGGACWSPQFQLSLRVCCAVALVLFVAAK